jgi:UDP-N-acetylglucosamine acyltransferase
MTDVDVLREVAPSARISPDAVIGLYCSIGPNVTIGSNTILGQRVSVTGHTTIGSGNVVGDGCVFGGEPQDLKYEGQHTLLQIGHRNRFGSCVTAHVGTELGGYLTRVGDDNVFADGCHIAHDCYVDDHTSVGRSSLLAGHIRIESGAVIGDLTGMQHFVTIGRYACVGPCTPVRRDVPPYTYFVTEDPEQHPPTVLGPHEAGIRAAGLDPEEQRELRHALSELFDDEIAMQTKIEQLINLGVEGEVAALCEFCQRSLQGQGGRHRELYRGKPAPEAKDYLPPEFLARIRRDAP